MGPSPACHDLFLQAITNTIYKVILFLLVNAESEFEEGRIPVQVKHIKELDNAVVVYPKNSIVKHSCAVGIKFQSSFQLLGPMPGVEL